MLAKCEYLKKVKYRIFEYANIVPILKVLWVMSIVYKKILQ